VRLWFWLIGLLLLVSLAVWIYPWPSPRPVPGHAVQVSGGGGSREAIYLRMYTSRLSLPFLKNFYGFQMWLFCDDRWSWATTAGEITARCQSVRFGTQQTFTLSLRPQPGGGVQVTQEDVWLEP
jgi:hypothetical protein